jgi:hypothetical protein
MTRLEVRPPDGGRPTVFEGERIAGRSTVRFLGADRPGIYRVLGTDAKGDQRELEELAFAVNLDPRGSDLTPAPPTALPASGTSAGAAEGAGEHQDELWHAVAAGLLLLLLLESVLVLRR